MLRQRIADDVIWREWQKEAERVSAKYDQKSEPLVAKVRTKRITADGQQIWDREGEMDLYILFSAAVYGLDKSGKLYIRVFVVNQFLAVVSRAVVEDPRHQAHVPITEENMSVLDAA